MRPAAPGVTPLPALKRPSWQAGRRLVLASLALLLAACATQPQTRTVVRPSTPATSGAARTVDATQAVPVALLLPGGSADSAVQAIARDMEDAARLAVDEAAGLARIDLQVRDSGSTAATAEAAAREAAAAGAPVILGPVFAEQARAVAPVTRETGVPALSFSNFAEAASPPTYILGLAPEDEIERILAYAAGQGIRRIGLVHPEIVYGEVARDAVFDLAPRYGLDVVYTLSYPYSSQASQDAISDEAPRMAAANPDGVLIVENNGQVLTWILSFLALNDVRSGQQQFLGVTGWETGGGLRAPELVGGWYPALDAEAMERFRARFESRYGRTPRQQAAVAYDGVRLVAELLAQARRTGAAAPFAPEALTAQGGFEGATGRFRLRPDGRITRAMPIMEVGPAGPIMRAPAAPAGS
jgi:ABC-type branched-subunit amino acid transport system substrate-binding protein